MTDVLLTLLGSMVGRQQHLAILTGAGASYGAGAVLPHPPPLGGQLHSALVAAFPDSWGALSPEFGALFEEDFETGMHRLWQSNENASSVLLVDMARYFLQFEPAGRSDCYSQLVEALLVLGLLPRTVIATLNYECVLDLTAANFGLKLAYLSESPPPDNLLILKPHGACNLLPQAQVFNLTLLAQQMYEGPLRALSPNDARKTYDAGFALPAAMSLFAPGKDTPVARHFVTRSRWYWRRWALSADCIVVIGARPLLADLWIWEPILRSTCRVLYIGGVHDMHFFEFSQRVGSRLRYLGPYFDGALPALVAELRQYADFSRVVRDHSFSYINPTTTAGGRSPS
jgi:hypothetical protein